MQVRRTIADVQNRSSRPACTTVVC